MKMLITLVQPNGMQNGNDVLTVGFLLLQYSVVYIEDLTRVLIFIEFIKRVG